MKYEGTVIYEPPCRKCAGVNGLHTLRCPVVNLTPGWYQRILEEREQ